MDYNYVCTDFGVSGLSLSLNSLLSLTPHVHLTILISAHWIATSFSFLTGQDSLPCNILLCSQLLFHESLIAFSSTVTLFDTPFRQFDPAISCLSFTVCFAIRKKSFWWLGSFKSLAHSLCFFSFGFCLLFLYSFHASVEFCFFSNFHTFLLFPYCFSNLFIPPPCFLMCAQTFWRSTCDLCCFYHFHLLPVFIYIKVFDRPYITSGISTFHFITL